MQKEIGFYDDLTDPYIYSYSPYTKMWYEDNTEQMPEPDIQPEELYNFKIVDKFGNWAVWAGHDEYYKYEEEIEEFEKYVRYICGDEDLAEYDGAFSASILLKSENQKKYIHIADFEFIDLDDFIKNIDNNNYSSHYIEGFTGVKFFVWKKANNKIRLLVQQYNIGTVGYIDYDLLTVDFDVLVDKDEVVNEFMRFINKYKKLLFEKINEYEKEHNIKFSNPMNIPYINHWLENN